MSELVSIIIPTLNNSKTLGFTLESVGRQTYEPMETLTVDSFSRDATVSIAEAHGVKTAFHSGTVSSARNHGLAASAGEYVLFLDADQMLEPTCVEECVSVCRNGAADAVKIPETFLGLDYWGKCFALLKNANFELGMKREGVKSFYPRFWRKAKLREIGGFDDKLSWGEDKECYLRARRHGLATGWSRSRILHVDTGSLRTFTKKRIRYAVGIRAYRRTINPRLNETHEDPYTAFIVPVTSNRDPYIAYAKWGVSILRDVLARSRDPLLVLGAVILCMVIASSVILQGV